MDQALEKKFNDLYEGQYRKLYAHIYNKLLNKELAEDMTHEVFLSVYQNMESFDETKASINTWLYCIANNRLKNYYRDKKDNSDIDDLMEVIPSDEDSPMEQAYYLEELRSLVAELLEELPERQRQLIIYTYFEGLNSKEVADKMGISSGNVRITLMRGIDKLREKMEEKGLSLEDFT